MAITPHQALNRSPAAKLTDDEKQLLHTIKDKIDNTLCDIWTGGPIQVRIDEPCSQKVAGYVAKAYLAAGWNVTMGAMDGVLGKAVDLVQAGANVNWLMQLIPDWSKGPVNGTSR